MIGVLYGILVFGVVVFVHEFGHFLMARLCRVPVDRFSIGFGPKVWGVKRGATEYTISALPIGGYVKMAGDEMPEDGAPPSPDTFLGHPWWHRILIAVAGPGANFLFAVAVAIVMFWSGIRLPDAPNVVGKIGADSTPARLGLSRHDAITMVDGTPTSSMHEVRLALLGGEKAPRVNQPVDVSVTVQRDGGTQTVSVPGNRLLDFYRELIFFQPAVVGEVLNGFPAYVAGIREGDRIVAIDGKPVDEFSDLVEDISTKADTPIVLSIERDGRVITIRVTPMKQIEDGRTLGRIGIGPAAREVVIRYSPGQAIVHGAQECVYRTGALIVGLYNMFRHITSIGQSISGPIAIIEMSGEAAQKGIFTLLNMLVGISIALMTFNLLPVPILDGGLVVMAVAEGIRRRPVSIKVQAAFQRVGLVLLGSLILFVLFNDPLKIIKRNRAISRTESGAVAPDSGRSVPDGGAH